MPDARPHTMFQCTLFRRATGMTFLGLVLASLILSPTARARTVASIATDWRNTGLQLGSAISTTCVDTTTPGLLLTAETRNGAGNGPYATYTNNYVTGQRNLVAMQGFDTCNSRTGSLFTDNGSTTPLRFSVREPAGRTIDYSPTYVAPDGSVLYSFRRADGGDSSHLFVSTNDGLTWQEQGRQFSDTIAEIAPVDGVARSLYALVMTEPMDRGKAAGGIPYTLQFSADAGMTWEQRYAGIREYKPFYGYSDGVGLFRIPGLATPVTTIGLTKSAATAGPHGGTDILLSADGGRSFGSVGSRMYGTTGFDHNADLYATSAGIISVSVSTGAARSAFLAMAARRLPRSLSR